MNPCCCGPTHFSQNSTLHFVHSGGACFIQQRHKQINKFLITSAVQMDEWQSPEQASGMGCISGTGVCVSVSLWVFLFFFTGVMHGCVCGGQAVVVL